MTNIKKVAAGIIAGAAITAGPLVAFAAPAFADTGAAKPVADAPSHMNIPPSGYKGSAKEQHVLVNSAAPETHPGRDDDGDGDGGLLEDLPHTKEWPVNSASPETRVLVNAASAGSLQGANATRCGGTGIPC